MPPANLNVALAGAEPTVATVIDECVRERKRAYRLGE
jgi:hypothetical protein